MEEENRELLLLLSRVGNFNFQLRFRFQIARLDLENLGKKFRWNFSRRDYFSIPPSLREKKGNPFFLECVASERVYIDSQFAYRCGFN